MLTVTLVGTLSGLTSEVRPFGSRNSGDLPNTDIKEGNESGADGELVCTGMVRPGEEGDEEVHLRLKGDTLSGSQLL